MARLARGLLAAVAIVLLALEAGLAVCMTLPVRWDGLGKLGAIALFFPLHLLLVAAAAGLLALVAVWSDARLAERTFTAAGLLALLMALVPAGATWWRARQLGVPLSVGNYLANARHLNSGRPHPDRTVVYGVAPDGTQLELDVWRSGKRDTGPPRPAILLVHGGAWAHGNRSMLPDWNRWLNELGYEVFDVEYRLPPPVRWRDEVGDVKSALGWIALHAAEYHVNPARINLMGGSAGANLALLAAYTTGDPELPPSTDVPAVNVRAVVDFYGPVDMALLYRTCKSPDYVRPLMVAYLGGTPDEVPDRYRLLSPLVHVSAASPPTLALLGTSDRLVSRDHATLLDHALGEAGVPHETVLLPANDHGFDANWGGFGTQIARAKIADFLQRYAAGASDAAVAAKP